MDPHVAVLVLDTPIEGVSEKYGDFGDNVKSIVTTCNLKLVKYQVAFDLPGEPEQAASVNALFDLLTEMVENGIIKAVVLTGSKYDSFAVGNPWLDRLDIFVKDVLLARPDFPSVGLCFGHQVLSKNLGSKVGRNVPEIGWEAGTATISLNKSILDVDRSPFRSALVMDDGKILEHINLVEFHRDIVYGMPPVSQKPLLSSTSFQSLGCTQKCSIQGLVTDSGPIKVLTFQGHPEFSTEASLKMLEIDVANNIMDQHTFERLTYNTKNLINQGPIIGDVILTFINTYT